MAARLSTATPIRTSARLVARTYPPSSTTRQFACSATRAKEVASQDELPNLRHAQRPRKRYMLYVDDEAMLICFGSWWKATRANCKPNRQVPRESCQPPQIRSISAFSHAQIHPAIFGVEGRAHDLYTPNRRYSCYILPEISYRC